MGQDKFGQNQYFRIIFFRMTSLSLMTKVLVENLNVQCWNGNPEMLT